MIKLSPKISNLLSMFLMVFIMTFVVVFVTTLINFGPGHGFFFRWMRGWGLSFIIAFPTVLLIMPIIKKFISKITRQD